MATARFIVNSALRKLGILAAGREPRTPDATDALSALSSLYSGWIASGACGRLEDVIPLGTDYTARGNERIYRREPTLTVNLPETVSDGWVYDYGSERRGGYTGTVVTIEEGPGEVIVTVQPSQPIGYATTPRDLSAVVISDREGGNTRSWLYDGTTKKWEGIDALTLDSAAPRSAANPDGLAACLAMMLTDQYGVEAGGATMRAAAAFNQQLTMRFGMRREDNYSPQAYF